MRLSVIVALCALSAMFVAAVASADNVQVPAFYQGAWSTNLEYCGKDSDGNYFISPKVISGWEVSWEINEIVSKSVSEIIISSAHSEYENTFPVIVNIKRVYGDVINFQECEEGHCWQFDLHRCPEEK